MVALLQGTTDGGPVLLNVIEGMGHAGGAPTSSDRTVITLLAFLARHTGLVLDEHRDCASLHGSSPTSPV